MPMLPFRRHRQKRAFTLAELSIVVFIIGVIGVMIIPRFSGEGTSKTRAQALMIFADSAATIIRSSVSQIGTGFFLAGDDTKSSNPIRENNNWMDVLTYGPFADFDGNGVRALDSSEDLVKRVYQGRYTMSGSASLKDALAEIITPPVPGTSPGVYSVQGYPVELYDQANGDTVINAPAGPCAGLTLKARTGYFVFRDVPVDVVGALMLLYEDAAFNTSSLKAVVESDATHVPKAIFYGTGPVLGDALFDVCLIRSLK